MTFAIWDEYTNAPPVTPTNRGLSSTLGADSDPHKQAQQIRRSSRLNSYQSSTISHFGALDDHSSDDDNYGEAASDCDDTSHDRIHPNYGHAFFEEYSTPSKNAHPSAATELPVPPIDKVFDGCTFSPLEDSDRVLSSRRGRKRPAGLFPQTSRIPGGGGGVDNGGGDGGGSGVVDGPDNVDAAVLSFKLLEDIDENHFSSGALGCLDALLHFLSFREKGLVE
eukprot:CAMPEP_0171778078 /NCGR_PEP_ID=MMETSP0991-20121206/58177_1 /TAXON_ID=483369 /ORGANISM="non described non described, Strain CCMP2098" /LENGTH=222 /DNA_ID=CAMNT_0012384943 /DNA_START=361 /DNA_END=1026 /DNA_ORIENTATION=+